MYLLWNTSCAGALDLAHLQKSAFGQFSLSVLDSIVSSFKSTPNQQGTHTEPANARTAYAQDAKTDHDLHAGRHSLLLRGLRNVRRGSILRVGVRHVDISVITSTSSLENRQSPKVTKWQRKRKDWIENLVKRSMKRSREDQTFFLKPTMAARERDHFYGHAPIQLHTWHREIIRPRTDPVSFIQDLFFWVCFSNSTWHNPTRHSSWCPVSVKFFLNYALITFRFLLIIRLHMILLKIRCLATYTGSFFLTVFFEFDLTQSDSTLIRVPCVCEIFFELCSDISYYIPFLSNCTTTYDPFENSMFGYLYRIFFLDCVFRIRQFDLTHCNDIQNIKIKVVLKPDDKML